MPLDKFGRHLHDHDYNRHNYIHTSDISTQIKRNYFTETVLPVAIAVKTNSKGEKYYREKYSLTPNYTFPLAEGIIVSVFSQTHRTFDLYINDVEIKNHDELRKIVVRKGDDIRITNKVVDHTIRILLVVQIPVYERKMDF